MGAPPAIDLPIQSENLTALYGYWLQLRNDRDMPSRRDFHPTDVPRLLPNLILFDVEAGTGRLLTRVLGTRIADLYGRDYTGRYLDEIDFGDERENVLKDYLDCVETGKPVLRSRQFNNIRDVKFSMERLILPFSEPGEPVNKVISGLNFLQIR